MNEFSQLRALAKTKRDKTIQTARDQHEKILEAIAELERAMIGRVPLGLRTVAASVSSVIPRDRPFSTADVIASLELLEPGRPWPKHSVMRAVSELLTRGITKRVRRSSSSAPALFVMKDVDLQPSAIAGMTFTEAVRHVLTKPMTTIEILVALLEAGYQTTMKRRTFRAYLAKELARGKYERTGARWSAL